MSKREREEIAKSAKDSRTTFLFIDPHPKEESRRRHASRAHFEEIDTQQRD